MPDKSSIGVLVSGGLDSSVLLAESAQAYRKVWPIYIRQGLAWEKVELYWLRKFITSLRRTPHPRAAQGEGIQPLVVLTLPMADVYGSHWSTGKGGVPGSRSKDQAVYLPGRNLALCVKAAVFCALNDIPALALGSLGSNPFPDASPRFFKRWGKVLGMGLGTRLEVLAPYRRLSKREVIRRGQMLPLELSFSCIAPKGKSHCGRCNKCAERRRAFKIAEVEDRTHYA